MSVDEDYFAYPPVIERAPESQDCGCHPEQVCECEATEPDQEDIIFGAIVGYVEGDGLAITIKDSVLYTLEVDHRMVIVPMADLGTYLAKSTADTQDAHEAGQRLRAILADRSGGAHA